MLWLALSAGCANSDSASAAQTRPVPAQQAEVVETILLRKAACDRARPGFRELSARAFEVGEGSARRRSTPSGAVQSSRRACWRWQSCPVTCREDATRKTQLPSAETIYRAHRGARPRPGPAHGDAGRNLDRFVAALRAADRASALALMTATKREHERQRFDGQSDESLHATGEGFVRFELKDSLGPYQAAVVTGATEPRSPYFSISAGTANGESPLCQCANCPAAIAHQS